MGWALLFWLITILGLEHGDMFMTVLFGAIAVWSTYLWLTKDKRKAQEKEKLCRQQVEREKKRKEQKLAEGRVRFENNAFVRHLIRSFRERNWADLDYTKKGCRVYTDRIETPVKTYRYEDYNLNNLDVKACEQLALYLGSAAGGEYEVEPIIRSVGYSSGSSYSGYVGSSGDIHISSASEGRDYTDGYKVYTKRTAPVKPQRQNW